MFAPADEKACFDVLLSLVARIRTRKCLLFSAYHDDKTTMYQKEWLQFPYS